MTDMESGIEGDGAPGPGTETDPDSSPPDDPQGDAS